MAFLPISALVAQNDSTFQELEEELQQEDLPADQAKGFQLLFTRGFMLGATSLDSVPLNGFGSGSYSLHGGIKLNLAKNIVGLRISPGFTWQRMAYNQNELKTYPTVPDSLDFNLEQERHLLFYLDLPVSLWVNLTKDEDGDSELFLEAGGYLSYMLGGNYKRQFADANDLTVIYLERGLQRLDNEWQRLRYGVFGRVGYKWASIYYGMRLSPLLDEFTNADRRPTTNPEYRNPVIPPMEVGITLFL